MKKILLAGAALIASVAMASAADLPSRKGAPLAPMFYAHNWTGFYAGVHAGYAWNDNSFGRSGFTPGFNPAVNAGGVPASFGNGDDGGFIGGGQIGYNHQFGSMVLGVEADLSFVDQDTSSTVLFGGGGGILPSTSIARQDMDWFGTARVRVGFTPVDRLLVYATGGVAFADVNQSVRVTFNPIAGGDFFGSRGDTKVGWTVGGGLEYAFTKNLSLKGEYLYYDLGSENIVLTDPVRFPADSVTYNVDTKGHIVRAGLNYKF
jgi:outer membrane immunogenic protein